MLNKIFNRVRALPMAADMWLAVVVLLVAFDKPVRWYVWTILAMEIVGCICIGILEKLNGNQH